MELNITELFKNINVNVRNTQQLFTKQWIKGSLVNFICEAKPVLKKGNMSK